MNWTALAVVTGLSTLFMIIQYVANQRQYDFNLDPPIVRPVNQRPPVAASAALDNQPAAAPSSPSSDRHRGIGFTLDARSDDDCSSYLLNKPRPQAAATSNDPRNHGNGGQYTERRNAGTDCTGIRQQTEATQPSVTNYNPLGGARYRNSDQSIGCGGGAQTLDGIRQTTMRSSNPCRGFEERAGSHSFEYRESQSTVTDMDAMNPSETARGSPAEAIEIITTPCDRNSACTPEVASCEESDDCEGQVNECRSSQRFCEQMGQAMSRSLDYIIRILNVLLVLLLIIDWFIGVQRGDDEEQENYGGGLGGARTNACSYWRNFLSFFGYDPPDCDPAWSRCQKR